MSNKVLVSGATGFIGQHVVRVLHTKGYVVHGISSRKPEKSKYVNQWHQINLLEQNSSIATLKTIKPDYLIHLAWYVCPGSYAGAENLKWVQATLQLMRDYYDAMGPSGRMVICGSGFEYNRNHGYCSENLTPLTPDSYYGKCKNATRQLFQAFLEENSLNGAWARIFSVYGPGEAQNRLVSSVITSLLGNQRAACSPGTQYRDYLHVSDVAKAIVAITEMKSISGAVNIGSGTPIQIKKLVEMIATKISKDAVIGLGDIPSSEADLPFTIADVRRLTNEVKFKPQYQIEEGLDQTIEWWKNNIPDGK